MFLDLSILLTIKFFDQFSTSSEFPDFYKITFLVINLYSFFPSFSIIRKKRNSLDFRDKILTKKG